MAEGTSQPANPYSLSLDPAFVMVLSGEWATGGVLEFFLDGQRIEYIKLAPSAWAVVASLFLAAIHSQGTHWLRALVPTQHLVKQLTEHNLAAYPTAQTIYKHVNAIRSKLALSKVRKLTGNAHLSEKQWADLLLENGGRLGYRIGLPPSQLRMFIGDEQQTPASPAGGGQETKEEREGSLDEWSPPGGPDIDMDSDHPPRSAK